MADQPSTYELTYILDGVLSEEQIKDLVSRVDAYIKDNGGIVVDRYEWGMRKLAYEMDGRGNGYYVNLYYEGPAELPARLERAMRINESVIRYLTLKLDAKMKRHYEKRKGAGTLEAAPPYMTEESPDNRRRR
ncbi:MAG: 30S ribosomal protein S6 [Bacteroidota bacterium]